MNFSIDNMPKEISPCPITEAVVEIRFESTLPSEVIPGLLYGKFPSQLKNIEKLPILQLPINLIENDPNFRYSPHYKAVFNNFVFQFGPRSVSVACINKYAGWSSYISQIETFFNGVIETGLIDRPQRIGLRYISFLLGQDIFKNIKVELSIAGNSLIGQPNNVLRSEFDYSNHKCVIQIANAANLKLANNKPALGSNIDIDIITTEIKDISKDFVRLIEDSHRIEKQIFFSLLKPEFLSTLNPVY